MKNEHQVKMRQLSSHYNKINHIRSIIAIWSYSIPAFIHTVVTYRVICQRADDAVEPGIAAVQRGHVTGHARVKLGSRRVVVEERRRWRLGHVTRLVGRVPCHPPAVGCRPPKHAGHQQVSGTVRGAHEVTIPGSVSGRGGSARRDQGTHRLSVSRMRVRRAPVFVNSCFSSNMKSWRCYSWIHR